MVLFTSINNLANVNNGAAFRRRKLFIPPSTRQPMFKYGEDEDDRSFLSLIENGSVFEEEEDISDTASVSTSRSLPESLSSAHTNEDQESFHSWLVEEHNRRISEIEEEEDMLNANIYGHRGRRRSSITSSKYSQGWEDFMKIKTNYIHESYVLFRHATPLIITFILEHFFSIVCLIVVGKLGTDELAAVSLATMTSTITFAIFEGIATSLDTLCPQAVGARNYEMMSLYVQRCIMFSWTVFIPCGLFWWFSPYFLKYIIDNENVVHLTSTFLRILILGAPAYIFFENSKRFLQSQGIFEAGTGVLFISAPINIGLSWFLVWNSKFGLGYIGSPIATVINFWIMSILLVLYVRFIDGKKCWFGIASIKDIFSDWGQIGHLALPGVVMIESEYLAYEIMTLFASYFGTTALAAQSAVASIASIAYMVPFAVSIAASTRIANFIGGQNLAGSLISTKVAMLGALVASSTNCLILFTFRTHLAHIFTDDPKVVNLIENLLHPLVAILQIFDGIASVNSGILRAQGLQKIGGLINFIAYYAFALPLALILSKVMGYKLYGLWIGVGSGMLIIALSTFFVILFSDWDQIFMQAGLLNESDDDDDNEL
ncbi:uncharacterized protein KGF55_001784 [Candida pseudojiufengensis]|uniref:uncharacterized protein n=1 Tax=Candida pseudojiufengensis TaxID=497109 RepID=UPI0022250603|nr:uncharacterized protein KGF55_001784 [Candida pseudojiufengensis]KAI5964715.1 hypothetical protein KGF55_001784 [Candida pseudojiufengensis]